MTVVQLYHVGSQSPDKKRFARETVVDLLVGSLFLVPVPRFFLEPTNRNPPVVPESIRPSREFLRLDPLYTDPIECDSLVAKRSEAKPRKRDSKGKACA